MKGTGESDSTENFTLPQWQEPSKCMVVSFLVHVDRDESRVVPPNRDVAAESANTKNVWLPNKCALDLTPYPGTWQVRANALHVGDREGRQRGITGTDFHH